MQPGGYGGLGVSGTPITATEKQQQQQQACEMQEDPVNLIRDGGDFLVLPMHTSNVSECIAACCDHAPKCVVSA